MIDALILCGFLLAIVGGMVFMGKYVEKKNKKDE